MNLLGILKRKYLNTLQQRDVELRVRRQLNMTIDIRLIELLKNLAAQFTVPRNVLGEHVLEVGCYYLTTAMEREQNTKILRQHLIDVHLIDNGVDDSAAILRMGEGSNVSQLLLQVDPVINCCRALRQSIPIAKKTGNFTYFDKCKKELLQSAIRLVQWLEEQHVGEWVNEETQVDM